MEMYYAKGINLRTKIIGPPRFPHGLLFRSVADLGCTAWTDHEIHGNGHANLQKEDPEIRQ